ncbi:unnamed protein product [Schistosoma margrebowiei]|uniref:Uncharacterized protein n=1 Tax=Schistosoma margrebowiei TaxID=48269 RepID=A0A183NA47_9TREM|nr:unnamed protein product [Schistosoma margrebowiei]
MKSTNNNNNHKKLNHKKEPEREVKVKNKLTNILQINDELIKELGIQLAHLIDRLINQSIYQLNNQSENNHYFTANHHVIQ